MKLEMDRRRFRGVPKSGGGREEQATSRCHVLKLSTCHTRCHSQRELSFRSRLLWWEKCDLKERPEGYDRLIERLERFSAMERFAELRSVEYGETVSEEYGVEGRTKENERASRSGKRPRCPDGGPKTQTNRRE